MSDFKEHYSSLHNDDLIHIALTRELVPEAKQALMAELKKRGINDLSTHKKVMEQEHTAENKARQEFQDFRQKVWWWLRTIVYTIGLLCMFYGAFHLYGSNKSSLGTGIIFVVLGFGLIAWAWIQTRITELWWKYVLVRKPPR